jgi:NAD(P)-dependent dehydrogenase (short-subunit alcohol dehydrogenase family)
MQPRPQYMHPTYRPAQKLAGKVALITGGDSGRREREREREHRFTRSGPSLCVCACALTHSTTIARRGARAGGTGIGRAVAVLYAREGARVALGYLPEEQDDADVTRAAVDDEAAAGGACLLLPGDLRHPSACRDAVARTVQHYGRLDILVNNAATQRYHPTLQTITEDDLRATFEARVHGVCVRVRESENERERAVPRPLAG